LPGPNIFLSYNREDQAVAKCFAEAFEAAGLSVWWDVTLRSGEAYDRVTEDALRTAKAVVVLWSPRSVASRWVRAEASIADENGTLVPATIQACQLPVMFRLTQTAELSHWRGEAHDKAWLAFLGDVRRRVGQEPTEPGVTAGPVSAPTGSGIPLVAVLVLPHRAGAEELDYLAEDLTEEITRKLARSSYFEVIAGGRMASWRGRQADYPAIGKELGASYLAEGKLQRGSEAIQLTMQIVETATGKMLWSKRLARDTELVEVAPEDFAAAVAAELGENILQNEINRAIAKSGPLSGWEHVMRAAAYRARLGSDSVHKGIEEERQAVAAAPDLGLAHVYLAAGLAGKVFIEGELLDEALRNEIQTHVTRALQLDGDNHMVVNLLALPYAALGDDESALRLARRSVELNPSSPYSYVMLGFAYELVGRTGDAIAAYEQQDHLLSNDTARPAGLVNLGRCYLLEGRAAEAEVVLDRALALHPDYHNALKWKAIVAAHNGNEEAALVAVRRLRQVEPNQSIDQHVRQVTNYRRHAARLAEPVATLQRLWEATEIDPKAT
jgi:TolB-like protein/Flp pilus assembly protein TadD